MYNPQLETFLCVADSGSFNKAAEKLYISPPAVIKQINLLEESMDLQLFVRTHRGLTLTKAGQSLYQDTKYIIQYCRDWSHYVDLLRDDLWKNHPQIHIVDFDFYDVAAFNQCENNNCVLMAIENWRYVHPLLKILPVEWNYTIPFGLLYAPEPSSHVRQFLDAVARVTVREN